MPDVVEINRLEDLEGLRLVWEELFEQTAGASFFQTFDWTIAFLRSQAGKLRPRILIVYESGQAIGIVPLVIVAERTRLGEVDVLTYPLADWGVFYGPIGKRADDSLAAALAHVHRTDRDWDLLDLRWIPEGIEERLDTLAALQRSGFAARRGIWKETAQIEFAGDWNDYLATRTARFRSNLRRAERRTQALGRALHVRYRPAGAARDDDDPRWDLYDACVDLAERSWQGGSDDGTTLSHASVRGFLRETHALAARLGMVDLNLLTIDGRPVAFGYNYCHRQEIFGLRSGYDGAFADSGVGSVLYARMFHDSFERGDKLFDLGPGSLETKRRWLTRTAISQRFTHYPLLAPRAQILRIKHCLFDRQATLNPQGDLSA